MKLVLRSMVVLVVVLMGASVCFGATLTVPTEYATIQEGINAAAAGDVVSVLTGTYDEALTLKSDITLRGAARDGVVLRKGGNWNVIDGRNVANVTIENLTLMNEAGFSSGDMFYNTNAGAYLENSHATIRNVSVSGFGQGIIFSGASAAGAPTIDDSVFSGNGTGMTLLSGVHAVVRRNAITNGQGSGIYIGYSSHPQIIENRIEGQGYGISATESSNPLIEGNYLGKNREGVSHSWYCRSTIRTNTITESTYSALWLVTYTGSTIDNNFLVKNGGDAIWLFQSWPVATNNTIAYNGGDGIDGYWYQAITAVNNIIAFNGGFGANVTNSQWGGYPRLSYNDIYGNVLGATAPDVQVLDGNIYADPLLKDDGSYLVNPGSPTIDAGNPDPSYNDPDGTRNDMGVYGGRYAIPSGPDTPEEWLQAITDRIVVFPDDAFKNEQAGRKDVLEKKLSVVLKMVKQAQAETDPAVRKGILQGALQKLVNDILAKCDGHFGGNPANDWIVTYDAQSVVHPMLVDLITLVQTQLNALG